MALFQPLTESYKAIEEDQRICSTHISLYIALLQQWNINGGKNPILIYRSIIMKAAKISSRHTYNKCINSLHEYGYIVYEASVNPLVCSNAYLKSSSKE